MPCSFYDLIRLFDLMWLFGVLLCFALISDLFPLLSDVIVLFYPMLDLCFCCGVFGVLVCIAVCSDVMCWVSDVVVWLLVVPCSLSDVLFGVLVCFLVF